MSLQISPRVLTLAERAQSALAGQFARIDAIAVQLKALPDVENP